MMSDNEMLTVIDISTHDNSSQPMQSIGSAAAQAAAGVAQLGAAMGTLQQQVNATAASMAQVQQRLTQQTQAINAAAAAARAAQSASGSSSSGGFAQQLSSGIQALQQHATSLGQTFQGLGTHLNAPFQALGGAVTNVQNAVRGLGTGLTGALNPILQGAGFALATAGINGLAGAMQSVGGVVFGFNSQLQLANVAMTSFTGNATVAGQEIKALQVLAATSPFEFQDVLVGARRFQTLGLTAGQTITFLKDLSAISGSFGLDTNQFSRAELAIQQVGIKGKLTGEELRQMGNDGFNALKVIQTVTGQSMSSIIADITAGTFSAQKFFSILHEYAQRPDIQDLAKNIQTTFAVVSSNTHDLIQQFTSTATMPLFEGITRGLQGVNDALMTPAVQQFAADIGATFQDLISKLQPVDATFRRAFSFLQEGDIAAAASTAFQGIGQAVEILTGQMFGAGQNIIGELAGGLISAAGGALQQAAEFAAGVVASFLVGHSPPPQGPLQGVDQGGRATAEAWIQGFLSADFSVAGGGAAVAVKDALGSISGGLTIDAGRSALQGAGQDMAKLREVADAAAGATRTLGEELRANQSESQSLAREADAVKRSYDDQIEPLQRSLQSLRDQGNEQSKLYDIEKRRRDMTLSAQEKLAQGDPVKRAELQNQDDALAQEEKRLRLQEQRIRLDATGKTGAGAESAKAQEAAIERQINEIAFRRASIQAQMDGLVDREALARVKVAQAQADQADAQQGLQKAQDTYNKSIAENDLEKQIHTLKDQEEDANKPLDERKRLLDEQRQSLQEQSQAYGQLKADAAALTAELRQQETERKTAAKAKGAAGRDLPIGEGIPEADVGALAAQAGNKVGESMLGGIQAKIREQGPTLIGGAIGAAVGGATLGPIGVVAGGVFGAEFAKSLQEKVPDLGTILSDSLTTFRQALQGDWKPPGIDEWVNPFVIKVGNAGTALHNFKAELTGPVESANWAKAGQNIQDFIKQWDLLVSRLSGGKGLQLITDQDIKDISTLAAQITGFGANVLDTFNTLGNAFSFFGTGMRATITSLQLLAKGDIFGAIQSQTAAADAFGKIPQLIADEQKRAKERLTAQAPEVAQQARDTWGGYIKGAQLALTPLGPTIGDLLQPATTEIDGLATDFDAAAQTTARAAGVLTTDASAQLKQLAANTATESTAVGTAVEGMTPYFDAADKRVEQTQLAFSQQLVETGNAAETNMPRVTAAVSNENTKMAVAATALGQQAQTPIETAFNNAIVQVGVKVPLITAKVILEHSPMYNASNELGVNLINGLIESIDRGENPVLNSVNGLMDKVRAALGGGWSGGPAGGGGGSGGGSVNYVAYRPGQTAWMGDGGAPTAEALAIMRSGMGEIEAFIRQSAAQHGIDQDIAVRVAQTEGGLLDVIRQSDIITNGQREQSFGPFQLNINGGLGASAIAQGIDPRNPAQWREAVDYALATVAREGWGAFHGAAAAGIGNFQGVGVGAGSGPAAAAGATVMASLRTPAAMQPAARSQFQLVDQGLSPDAAAAFCGPYAAMLFANAVGRYPTAQEAQTLAARVGWTPGQGMAGIGSELALMQSMGLNAVQQEATPTNINADLVRGAPVAISTPAHYFEATGGTAEGGLNVGATGTALRGGAPVMTLDQISALGGGLQGVLTLQGQLTAAQGASLASYQRLIPVQAQMAAGQRLIVSTGAPLPPLQGQLAAGAQAVASADGIGATASTRLATVLDGLYSSVAAGSTPLDTLQAQLLEIGTKAGVSGAAGDLQALVDGTESGAQALENMAVAMARTNPGLATLVKNYQAAGGAARASLKDTEKFALDVLNVMHAAQGQDISGAAGGHENLSGIKASQGEKNGPNSRPGASSGGGGGVPAAGSPVAQPLAAVNTQIETGSSLLPALTQGWTDATAAINTYIAVDQTPVITAVQSQIAILTGDLVNGWHTAQQAVEDYIQKAKEAASLDVSGSHLEGAREIKRTGLYQLHEGEEVRTKAQVRQESYASSERGDSYVVSKAGYIDQRTINLNAIDPRHILDGYHRTEKRLSRLRARG